MSQKDKFLKGFSISAESITPYDPSQKAAKTTGPGGLMERQAELNKLETQLKILESQIKDAEAQSILLTELEEIPGRRRYLSDESKEELRENLRDNPLVTPITVRKLASGMFEIISGHNRVTAFRELGRDRIPAVVVKYDDIKAERGAFFANLLHSSLPDYEKFIGFKRLRGDSDISLIDVAAEAGIGKSHISKIMSFEKIPAEALAIVAMNPAAIGMNAVYELAQLAEKNADGVVEAIRKISSGELTQVAAIKMVKDGAKATQKLKAVRKSSKLKLRGEIFAEIEGAGQALRISFKTAEDRIRMEIAIEAVIKKHIKDIESAD